MLKLYALLSATLVGLMGLVTYGQESPIQVKITPASTEVRNNQAFSVSVVIHNVSSEVQMLEFSTCGESIAWSTDNPLIHPHAESACEKPGYSRIALGPDKVFERTMHAHVALAEGKAALESVTFRLEISYDNHGSPPKKARVLSNAIAINVDR
jgi:hypothetical protein